MGRKRKKNGAFNRYFNTRNREDCSWCCSHLDPAAAAGLMQTPVNSLNLTKLGIIWFWFRAPGAPGLVQVEMSYGKMLSTRKFRCLFTLDSDSCIIGVVLEWCYTLLVLEATASPISLDKSKRFGCQILVKVAIKTRQDKRSYSALASQTPKQTPIPI